MTLVCGIKLTHDGGLTVIDSPAVGPSRLLAAVEAEKRANGARHAEFADADLILAVLNDLGLTPADIDTFVVDGWGRAAVAEGLPVSGSQGRQFVRTAPYRQSDDSAPPLHRYLPPTTLKLGKAVLRYASYRHVDGHLASAYLTRPRQDSGNPCLVLVWDGGVFPELYLAEPDPGRVRHLGPIFRIPGSIYSGFSCNVPPFLPDSAWNERERRDFHLTMPGKVMAYAGLGELSEEFVADVTSQLVALDGCWDAPGRLYPAVEPTARRLGLSGPDILAGFQEAVARMLVTGLARAQQTLPAPVDTLCFAGGSALNIKWNSAIRASGLFASVWVPPFPNDSGSATGTACAELMAAGEFAMLDWSVYAGPALTGSTAGDGWQAESCDADRLGAVLYETGEPVVVLAGRAELGPRALGHRSILASPVAAATKLLLNQVKGREQYRPVAPMCLEEFSAKIFDPGGPDPYMLFDHRVRPAWYGRIPAVMHVDGTARLQTVNDTDAPVAAAIVRAFFKRSGIPVLCNTSANLAGRGFFPDAASAMEWGRVDRVWVDGTLFTRVPTHCGAGPNSVTTLSAHGR
jgi:carbamoyltransferase